MISSHSWRCSGIPIGRRYAQSLRLFFLLPWLASGVVYAAGSPLEVGVAELEGDAGAQRIEIQVRIPPKHFIYAESWRVRSEEGEDWKPLQVPAPQTVFDTFSEENKDVYASDFKAAYEWTGPHPATSVVIEWQGCDDRVCFFPEEKRFELRAASGAASPPNALKELSPDEQADWRAVADRFEVVGRHAGYLAKNEFLAFLNEAASGQGGEDAFTRRVRSSGPWLGGLLILLGGLALNLTPCVLPMIPINLAIIGAGARAGSKSRGFLLGSLYGLGMAMAYGLLGVVAVATGSTFGALNSSPWFNAGIAVLFVILALAAFEVILIDFSRFQRVGTAAAGGGGAQFGAVLVMGVVSALLAGACVAPVVISVLLLTSALYSRGVILAALLPFLLGLGMALPWPLAGAGLALLPKPGGWMKWVNRVFGVIILALALYYGNTAWRLFQARFDRSGQSDKSHLSGRSDPENQKLARELSRAQLEQKLVFVDFWATWCKNCMAMEKTTFREPDVVARLNDFIVIKYQAERPESENTKPVLRYYGVEGLPTYLVLRPRDIPGGVR